jgi:protein gp37
MRSVVEHVGGSGRCGFRGGDGDEEGKQDLFQSRGAPGGEFCRSHFHREKAMSAKSAIEWTDATWPIVQGCDPVSQGCVHCYAVPLLWRLMHHTNPKISAPLQGLVEQHANADGETILRFTGKLALREDRLTWPLSWKEPRMIFVPSHGDIFQKDVPDQFIDKIFAVMALCPQHTFQVLTKRAERMLDYFASPGIGKLRETRIYMQVREFVGVDFGRFDPGPDQLPLLNVWLGVSCERQEEADERIPLLLQTPAAVRFISAEPLLGPINLKRIRVAGRGWQDVLEGWRDCKDYPGRENLLDWAIIGGESGSKEKAREHRLEHSLDLIEQCRTAGVAVFEKQLGSNPTLNGRPLQLKHPKGGDWNEWPQALRVREFPRHGH